MQTKEQAYYTQAISQAIARVNPYNSRDNNLGYIWASGFLAAYLASLAAEDPFVYKRLIKHLEQLDPNPSNKKP